MRTEFWAVVVLVIFAVTILALSADNAQITSQAIESLTDIAR